MQDTSDHNASVPLAIGLVLPAPGQCLRWHLLLAETLRRDGHALTIKRADVGPPRLPAWFNLLKRFEQTIYASRATGVLDWTANLPENELEIGSSVGLPEVWIDCCETPGLDAARVIRPGFSAVPVEQAMLSSILDGVPPAVGWRNGSGAALVQGTAAITATHIHSQTLSEALSRLVSMVQPAIVACLSGTNVDATDCLQRRPATAMAAAALSRALAERVRAALEKKLRGEKQWNVGWRSAPADGGILATGRLNAEAFSWLPRDAGRYFADPFPVEHGGRRVLFVEEYPYATGRGIISAFDIGSNGPQGAAYPIFERPHHLSYPCIFEHGGTLWMMPESAGAARLELFRCDRFPDRWTLHCVLFEGQVLADATFFQHGGRCWIAAGIASDGASDRDAMALFFADHPEGPWHPHPLNPVVVNVATARPAGWVRQIGSRLLRPVQDCTHGYGWGLGVMQVDELTEDAFAERRIAALPPPASLGATGFHTLNTGAGLEVIDAVI